VGSLPEQGEVNMMSGIYDVIVVFPRASFELGVRNPFATRAFVDLLSDRAGYAGVILRLLGTQPIYLAAEALSALRSVARIN
jgi:hypothetical protein